MAERRLSERNAKIAAMLESGEGLKNFYRFIAQNEYINLHDACQIVIERPDATVCNTLEEWNAMGRRVIKGRKSISFYDQEGYKQFVFDANDTYGDGRYQRPILPLKHLLIGLDELNGTNAYEDERGDYRKIHNGVYTYLEKQGELTGDEQYDGLLAEGIAYSLYCKTGFPKTQNIRLRGLPYSYRENADFVKELYIRSELIAEEIEEAYQSKQSEVKIIDDTDEETVSDEPVVQSEPAEQTETQEQPDQTEQNETPEQGAAVSSVYRQYLEAQQLNPKAIVLLRVGDFYEVMGENARTVADELDLTLTSREVGLPERVLMCGFSYHVTETYLEKILEKHSVILAEDGKEPIYVLSHAEALGQNETSDTVPVHDDSETEELLELFGEETDKPPAPTGKEPVIVEIDDDEPNPFDDEQSETEETEEDEDAAESDESNSEQAESKAKVKSTPKKDEKGIQDRKRKQKPQMSMFDLLEPQEKSREEQIVDTCLKEEYSDYKLAYYDAYRKNLPISEFVALFKRHYGEYNGRSDGEKSITNTTKGRKIEWQDKEHPENNFTVQLKWPEVAVRIAELIENDDYLTPNEKKEYARIVRFREERESAKTDSERCKVIADQIVEYGTQKTYSEVFSEYPHFLEDHAQFYFDHREEIKQELLTRKEVAGVRDQRDRFDNNISVSFHIRYCPRWQESLRRHLMIEHRVQDFADGFIQACADRYDPKTGGDTVALDITSESIGELTYLFIKDNRDEFTEYLQQKKGVIRADFSMQRIMLEFRSDYIAGIAEGKILPPGEQTQRVRAVADKIIAEGIENTTEGNWVHFFDEFGEDETFARENAEEITAELERHQEVSDVILTPDGFDTNFYLDYCPNYISKEEGYENSYESEPSETADTGQVKIGDRFRYEHREWEVKGFDGLYPNQAVITCTDQAGGLKYDVTQNIDIKELLEKGERIKPEQGENTDLTSVLDQTELGGAKTRFKNNVAAIRLVNFLYDRNAMATDAEKKVLSQFVGWGGLAQAFDEKNESWKKEYAELKNLLSTEDYEQARSSTLNAYYTAKDVIGGIYAALERFGVKGNNRILEPAMGTGNFFGYMPKEIADGSRLYGVELDNITGRIAAKLYPQANVQIKGFEDTSFPNDKFDIVVGNVPFGGYGVADSDYNRYNFKVHDYFLAKNVDKVRPGGIVAIITSKGTMDKLNPSARKYVAERAELLGAIRLPNNAFKQTAGTEAVADILFFRKREEKITDLSGEEWLGTGKTAEGYEINNYFISHPEMILGTLAEEHGLYGGIDTTVKPDGRELKDALAEAVKHLPQGFYNNPETPPEQERETEVDYNVKPFCYKAERGKLYQRVGDEMVEQSIPKAPKDAYQRICGMIGLREELHHVLDIQIAGCSDEVLTREQWALNSRYDLFVKKYGNLNSQTNVKLFKDDGDSALLFACENVNEETKAVTKADIFFKRTIRPYIVPTSTDDPFEALQISKNERGKVDIAYIEELTGKDYETVVSELGSAVFRNPEQVNAEDKYSGFVTAEEYLSGRVVTKLERARSVAAEHPEYQRNADALEAVQPEPLTASEISVRLGATWVDKAYYKRFYCELVGVRWYLESDVELFYNPHDSSWRLDQTPNVRYTTQMNQTEVYGTKRAPAYRLFIDAMNLKATTIYDTIEEDGKEKRVLNQAETIAAREKQNKIKEAFVDWIFKTPERREELEATYNRLFNRTRLPSYDGSYLKFPGMNPAVELKPHQKNAVHRIITSDSSTLLHHVVGAGKTFTVIASVMKMRQLGLCKKAMVTVPNHLVQQWAGEWRKLYPNARILVATKEDLEKDNRKKFVSKAALGDWDGIIIAQSSFAKIPVSKERQVEKLQEEIASVEETIERQWEENGAPRGAVKNLERIKKTKKAQLKKLMADSGKDDVLKFEDLGVDYLFVDEAQGFKNLFLFSKMNNVAGISNAASQRASDLKLKCEYLQELHGSDRGVVFATGTPISNSMTEMYTMQTYLQPSVLRNLGITFFDGWAADFGETITSMELSPSGQGYRARTRFAKFTNLPELLKLYRSFADVQTADMVKLNVPEAERHVINLKPSDTIIELAEEIADRADRIYGGGVDSHIDNMLKVTSDGKKLALDPRCFVPTSEDGEGSKLNDCAQNIYEIWEDTQSIKGTQIVFCDLSTPKVRFEDYAYGTDFDAYNDLKFKLVQKGIPAQEIAFIHEANTDEQKQALFDKVNAGAVRVLIGSTEKCGAGTNVQKRLVALHHLDTPYRPSDMEQREGRIIRQGNTNEKVQIYTYVMERTFDSYSYQILENKQRFISQINRGDLTVREAEDIDETTLSYAEIKAITAANPKIKRKMEVDAEVARLRVLEGQYRKNLYDLQDKIYKTYPEEIRKQELLIERIGKDLEMLKTRRPADSEAFEISVNGKVYTDKKEGGKALTDALYGGKVGTPVAEYCGFVISMNPMSFLATEREITLAGEGQYVITIGDSASGNLTRIENFLNDLPEREKRMTNKLEQLKSDLAIAKEQAGKPFEQAERLKELLSEQAQLNAELNLNQREEAIVDDGDEEDEITYRALPENRKTEVDIIDEEDKIAAMQVDLLPDYTVTQEDMRAYGYTWDGMLPVSGTAAKTLANAGIAVNELRTNDTEGIVDDLEIFEDKDKLFGVEKPEWKAFLQSENGAAYMSARAALVDSVCRMLNREDMAEFGEQTLEPVRERYEAENKAIKNYLAGKEMPSADDTARYINSVFDERYAELTEKIPFREHGWNKDDIQFGMCRAVENDWLTETLINHGYDRRINEFVDERLKEIKWLNGRTEGFTAEEIENLTNELKPAFEGSEFVVRMQGESYDDWYDYFVPNDLRPLLEQRKAKEDTVEKRVNEGLRPQYALQPDYTVTTEDMHDYGYTKDGVLPLQKRVAQRLWSMGLEINKLSPDNTESVVQKFSELTPTERTLFGIRKQVWENYLNNEKTPAYLWARKEFCDAASKVANEDMSSVDERFTIDFSETNFKERMALEQYLANKEKPESNVMPGYVPELLDEFSLRLWSNVLHEYGWDESDMPKAIARHLADPAMQQFATDILSDEQKSEEAEDAPLYEDSPLDLPAQDDALTVLAVQPDVQLDEKRTLPGLKLLKNEEIERWYVVNRAAYEGERELKIGDKTTLEELEISPMEFDPNVIRTFYDEQSAKDFYSEKVGVLNSVKDNYGSKEIDYEAEVIKSVNTEFEVYKADVLSRSPEDIFYENYKIHVMTELKEVIEEGVLNDYIDKEYYRALYEDRGSILTALYDDFIGDEYASVNSYGETAEFIKNYCEQYHHSALYADAPLYLGSIQYAREHGELNEYSRSHKQSEECREAIDKAISKNYDGLRLKDGFIPELINEYGAERVQYILATTVRENLGDGRYSPENKSWAQNIAISESAEERRNCCLHSHPAVIDGVINSFQKYMKYNSFLNEVLQDNAKQPKKEEEDLAESKYLKETARGYKVMSIAQDKNGRNVAVVQRKNDFTVAVGYDTSDGTWAQGVYDFKDEKAANEYRERHYGKDVEPPEKWYEVFVSRDALIKTYEKSSLMRMPSTNREYADYTYFVYNNRIKESRQLVDMQSDSRELCYKILLSEGEVVHLRNRDGDEVELSAQEFSELVNHTADKDYAREEKARVAVHIPQTAMIKNYEKASLFRAPNGTDFAGYSYYLPNSVLHESADGSNAAEARLAEDFTVRMRKGEEEVELTAKEFSELVGKTTAEDYKREPTAMDEYREQQAEKEEWKEIAVSEQAVIANYEKSTLFKMPKGKYEGMVYYIPSGMVRRDENGIRLRLPEDFEVHLKDKDANEKIDLSPAELESELAGKTDEDYENLYRRPSEEARKKFEQVEKNLRESLPDEMKNKPNWVVVRTRENKETGRLDKFLIDVHTGKFAESNEPETWTDFDAACKYAKEHGGVALAYALDDTDGIACIDLDHCIGEDGKRSALADEVLSKCGKTYSEQSVSGRGIHVFGRTKGTDLRSFSKDGDMEYYQDRHFITMTGDGANCSELASFDTPEMQSLLERKLERRTEWKNVGKGEAGLSQMDDRELLEKAFSAKNGDTVRRLYHGEDLRHNHSNSDMSLMNYLAFYSGGNVEQMTRIFATSGLYRPDKPASYYEYTAIKAAKDTPHYTPPKAKSSAPKSANSGNSK